MLLGLGNNVNGALDLGPVPGHLPSRTDSTSPGAPLQLSTPHRQRASGAVCFHDWTCTVVRLGSTLAAWGNDPVVDELTRMRRDNSIAGDPRGPSSGGGGGFTVLPQHDRPAGILAAGRVLLLGRDSSSSGADRPTAAEAGGVEAECGAPIWDNAAVTDVGVAVATHRDGGVYAFRSLGALSAANPRPDDADGGVRLSHPLLDRGRQVGVYATESRALLEVGEEVLEIDLDLRGLEKENEKEREREKEEPTANQWRPRLRVLDELSGLGVTQIISGKGNRFGAVTQAGEAYLLTREGVERVDLTGIERGRYSDDNDNYDPPTVVDVAIGEEFELVLLEGDPEHGDVLRGGRLYGRGKNEYGQLGVPEKVVDDWVLVRPSALGVWAGRWSTIISVDGDGEPAQLVEREEAA